MHKALLNTAAPHIPWEDDSVTILAHTAYNFPLSIAILVTSILQTVAPDMEQVST